MPALLWDETGAPGRNLCSNGEHFQNRLAMKIEAGSATTSNTLLTLSFDFFFLKIVNYNGCGAKMMVIHPHLTWIVMLPMPAWIEGVDGVFVRQYPQLRQIKTAHQEPKRSFWIIIPS